MQKLIARRDQFPAFAAQTGIERLLARARIGVCNPIAWGYIMTRDIIAGRAVIGAVTISIAAGVVAT